MIETRICTRKPVDVQEVQVTEQNMPEVAEWCNGAIRREPARYNKPGLAYIYVEVEGARNDRQKMAYATDHVLFGPGGFKVYTDKAFVRVFDVSSRTKMSGTPEDLQEKFAKHNDGDRKKRSRRREVSPNDPSHEMKPKTYQQVEAEHKPLTTIDGSAVTSDTIQANSWTQGTIAADHVEQGVVGQDSSLSESVVVGDPNETTIISKEEPTEAEMREALSQATEPALPTEVVEATEDEIPQSES